MNLKTLFLVLLVALVACNNLNAGQVNSISAEEAKALIEKHSGDPNFVILDIRTPKEFRQGHIPNAINIDYYNPKFKTQLDQLDRTKTYLLYCRSGNRTGRSLKIFGQLGFTDIHHLKHGIIDWQRQQFKLAPSI